jgi:hypothetical protein
MKRRSEPRLGPPYFLVRRKRSLRREQGGGLRPLDARDAGAHGVLHLFEGADFDLTGSSLSPLEPFRDHLTFVSNTDVHNAEAFTPPEIGGDHFRSAAVFLTQAHPHQTQGKHEPQGRGEGAGCRGSNREPYQATA